MGDFEDEELLLMMEEENELARYKDSQVRNPDEAPAVASTTAPPGRKLSQAGKASQKESQEDWDDEELLWMMDNEAHESEPQKEEMDGTHFYWSRTLAFY
jgi:hypothetical protein